MKNKNSIWYDYRYNIKPATWINGSETSYATNDPNNHKIIPFMNKDYSSQRSIIMQQQIMDINQISFETLDATNEPNNHKTTIYESR